MYAEINCLKDRKAQPKPQRSNTSVMAVKRNQDKNITLAKKDFNGGFRSFN